VTSRFASTVIRVAGAMEDFLLRTIEPAALPFCQHYATRTAPIINPSALPKRDLLLNVKNHHPESLVISNISRVACIGTYIIIIYLAIAIFRLGT